MRTVAQLEMPPTSSDFWFLCIEVRSHELLVVHIHFIRRYADQLMTRHIVHEDEFLQHIDVMPCIFEGEIARHLRLQRAIESLDDAWLDVVFRTVPINVVVR